MVNKTILLVEDEVAIRDMIRVALEIDGYTCLEAGDIATAHELVVDHSPALILLDWMLPGNSGLELIRRLKRDEHTAAVPIIMLTARSDEEAKIQGLNAGADDYVTKPFSPRELLARINALLRRIAPLQSGTLLQVEELRLDTDSHRVFIGDTPLSLGPTEFNLLQFFMSHQDRAYSRGQLLDHVWGGNVYVEQRTVDVHIRRLRKALRIEGANPVDYGTLIQTVRGTGYRFSQTRVR